MQPYFYSFSEFVAMGHHGVYVWTCWGITLAAVLGFIFYSRLQRKQLVRQLDAQAARYSQRQRVKDQTAV